MAGYWWQCEGCGHRETVAEITNRNSIAAFIWDDLRPSSWNQTLLTVPCRKSCGRCMRITYEFPAKNTETVMVMRIVGLPPGENDYLPMMWETFFLSDRENFLFDFKFQKKRQGWGLKKPAVFNQEDLSKLFALYCEKAGVESFP